MGCAVERGHALPHTIRSQQASLAIGDRTLSAGTEAGSAVVTGSEVPADQKTALEYFDPGWLRTSKDPANPKLHYDYTAEGWQSARTPEDGAGQLDLGRQMLWSYYADGLLQGITDRGEQRASYIYDANNQLLTAHQARGLTKDGQTGVDVEASYEPLRRLSKNSPADVGVGACPTPGRAGQRTSKPRHGRLAPRSTEMTGRTARSLLAGGTVRRIGAEPV